MNNEKINQTKCLINSAGHEWMRGFYDTLPVKVRARLRASPYNLCPACLQLEVLPRVTKSGTIEQRLFAAIAVMETEVRKMNKGG